MTRPEAPEIPFAADERTTLLAFLDFYRSALNFDAAVEDSNRRTAAASSLDQLSSAPTWTGEHWNLRWVLVHMIEEYARHCGHADLIRESIDGDQAR